MRIMIETKDLMIKKGQQSDWKDMYYNLWRHAESAKYMLWDVTTSEEEAMKRMERTVAFEATHPYAWLVYEKVSGKAIGFAGLEILEEGVCGETGIAFGPEFVGRGYGKQALNALTEFAKNELGAKKFIACCRTTNIPSHKVQMACGFSFSHFEDKIDPRNNEPYVLECNYKML
ncbi:MAG: GNAT family N-acetyltransferase [Lachnospiraceae bacterium]|nr:GNAT family N-acetyltransferase [Lachnospiraceae bacterium]